jgi:hypothetical protein
MQVQLHALALELSRLLEHPLHGRLSALQQEMPAERVNPESDHDPDALTPNGYRVARSDTGGDRVYYIEFVEKNDGVPQQRFQEVVRMSNERWAAAHPDDELLMIIGRTWRLGPKPTYMVVWRIKDFTTFETWNSEFRTQRILDDHGEFEEVGTIVDAGVYEDLGSEVL